ncbi:Glycosyltransferase like family 2 [Vibrio sp. B1FLJ16]|uniref:glycosyltransferase family 2 protein n=1 Tax=Vibrio sp. B1FLJ16 TaxID=2751178 RepID=UPI0015F6E301|nr:glycosyltransferase family 2 protein [Vibrio sp. B1FLJ16]CAD7803121.1 Glycosyltransferase like family 2 [Vibrio sp. B1FLJ16]CAE6894197.1 Glycosyltransferase like family 2 [Vibrio sp. B1FLJ16]
MLPSISVVIPAKNEQGNIGKLVKEIHNSLKACPEFEIVITDDGSTDNTVQEALDAAQECGCDLQVVSHEKSCGQSTAVLTAVKHAKGEWIITSDADGQNDPSDMPGMLELAAQVKNLHFCIAGYRAKRLDTTWVRFQSKVANTIRHALLGDGVPDSGCGLKVIPKATYLRLPYFDHMHRFLPALIKSLDGEIVVHQVAHRDREVGTSNYNAWNRAWVGIVDLLGVIWLQRRTKTPTVKAVSCVNSK